jgi:MbtH protein
MVGAKDAKEGEATFMVVLNEEEQYSIWPAARPVPAGWRAIGASGPKSECLRRIREMWTDMRPLSVRKRADSP